MIRWPNFKKINRGDSSRKSGQSGFIQIIIVIIAALVILKYTYNLDVVGFLTTGKFKVWLDKIYSMASLGWEKYDTVILKIWNYIIEFGKNLIDKVR